MSYRIVIMKDIHPNKSFNPSLRHCCTMGDWKKCSFEEMKKALVEIMAFGSNDHGMVQSSPNIRSKKAPHGLDCTGFECYGGISDCIHYEQCKELDWPGAMIHKNNT